jgi:hypothetical protein
MLVLVGVSASCGGDFRHDALALSNGWSVRLPLATELQQLDAKPPYQQRE